MQRFNKKKYSEVKLINTYDVDEQVEVNIIIKLLTRRIEQKNCCITRMNLNAKDINDLEFYW